MVPLLQTLCTAAVRQNVLSAAAAAAAAGDEEPPPIDPRAVDDFFRSLQVQDDPGLHCESIHALVVIFEQLTPEQQQVISDVHIPTLMELFRSDDPDERTKAKNAVEGIVNTCDSAVRRDLVVGPIALGVMGVDDPEILRKRTADIRWILSFGFMRRAVVNEVVPRLVELSQRHDDLDLQCDAAWALCYILKKPIHVDTVVDAGAIPTFALLLQSPDEEVQQHVACGLAIIAADESRHRDSVLQSGAMSHLITILRRRGSKLARRNAARALNNVCCVKPRPTFEMVWPALTTLANLITCQDDVIIADACWTLCDWTEGTDGKIQEFVEAGLCLRRLVELLCHPIPDVHEPAIATVGNIFMGSYEQTQALLVHNPLPSIRDLLSSTSSEIQRLACLSISAFVMGGPTSVQAVIDCDIDSSLLQLLGSSDLNVREEAASAIRNFTERGTVDQIQLLVKIGCISSLCLMLTQDDANSKVVSLALEALKNILYAGRELAQRVPVPGKNPMLARICSHEVRGRSKLLDLRQHPKLNIRKQACDILDIYFGIVADDELLAVAVVGNGGEPPRQRRGLL